MALLHCTAEWDCVSKYTQLYVNSHMLFLHKATYNMCLTHTKKYTVMHAWLDQLILLCIGTIGYEMYNSVNTVSCCPSGALCQLFVWGLSVYIDVHLCMCVRVGWVTCVGILCKDTCNSFSVCLNATFTILSYGIQDVFVCLLPYYLYSGRKYPFGLARFLH